MANTRENSGVLNASKQKLKSSSPDFYGKITLSKDMLKYLTQRMAKGETIELSLGGWKKDGPYGPFISLSASEPREQTTAPSSRGAYRPVQPSAAERVASFDDDDEIPF